MPCMTAHANRTTEPQRFLNQYQQSSASLDMRISELGRGLLGEEEAEALLERDALLRELVIGREARCGGHREREGGHVRHTAGGALSCADHKKRAKWHQGRLIWFMMPGAATRARRADAHSKRANRGHAVP
jgi:hypothetical protein